MSSRQIKNTRLFYNDEKNLKIYQALSAEDFKELFMACLTYKVGTDVEITDFSSPSLYGLFMMYKDKIDYNETKWLNSGNASRENGKKGGRPKKQTPIEPNDDFNVETVEKIPCNIINEPAVEYRSLSHVNPNIIPQEEFISDEQKYGSDVMDLIEDNPEIITALKSVVEYHSGDIDKEYQASMANTKIDQIVRSRNNDSDFVRRVEKFCADFITEYKEYIFNKNNNEDDN